MNSKETAKNQLLIGYIFAAIGLAIGASNDIYNNPVLSFFMLGYLLWSVYWGYQIVSTPINDFFGKMIVIEDNLIKLFFEYVMKKNNNIRDNSSNWAHCRCFWRGNL